MNFSLEIGPHTDLETLPPVKDVYVTMLPGGDYKETADKSGDLVKKGFNPVPHFPARSINNEEELKEYVSRCKDQGVKQALVIGGSREPIGKFDSSFQILETGYLEGIKIGIAGHPEGSPDISEQNLEKAMIDKKPYADYIVHKFFCIRTLYSYLSFNCNVPHCNVINNCIVLYHRTTIFRFNISSWMVYSIVNCCSPTSSFH